MCSDRKEEDLQRKKQLFYKGGILFIGTFLISALVYIFGRKEPVPEKPVPVQQSTGESIVDDSISLFQEEGEISIEDIDVIEDADSYENTYLIEDLQGGNIFKRFFTNASKKMEKLYSSMPFVNSYDKAAISPPFETKLQQLHKKVKRKKDKFLKTVRLSSPESEEVPLLSVMGLEEISNLDERIYEDITSTAALKKALLENKDLHLKDKVKYINTLLLEKEMVLLIGTAFDPECNIWNLEFKDVQNEEDINCVYSTCSPKLQIKKKLTLNGSSLRILSFLSNPTLLDELAIINTVYLSNVTFKNIGAVLVVKKMLRLNPAALHLLDTKKIDISKTKSITFEIGEGNRYISGIDVKKRGIAVAKAFFKENTMEYFPVMLRDNTGDFLSTAGIIDKASSFFHYNRNHVLAEIVIDGVSKDNASKMMNMKMLPEFYCKTMRLNKNGYLIMVAFKKNTSIENLYIKDAWEDSPELFFKKKINIPRLRRLEMDKFGIVIFVAANKENQINIRELIVKCDSVKSKLCNNLKIPGIEFLKIRVGKTLLLENYSIHLLEKIIVPKSTQVSLLVKGEDVELDVRRMNLMKEGSTAPIIKISKNTTGNVKNDKTRLKWTVDQREEKWWKFWSGDKKIVVETEKVSSGGFSILLKILSMQLKGALWAGKGLIGGLKHMWKLGQEGLDHS